MTEHEEFEHFYENKIIPELENLRYQSKQTGPWMVVGIVSVMLIVITFFIGSMNALNNYGVVIVLCIVVGIVAFYNFYKKKDEYEDEYKAGVIQVIIDYVSPGIIYKPREFLDEDIYTKSSLYRRYYSNYNGGDYMEGTIDLVYFRCSELFTYYNRAGRYGRGDSPIFTGLFFVIDINRRFTGGTYIWPSGDEQIPDSIYTEYYRMMPMPDINLLQFDDSVFNNYFSAYTTYPSQAEEILSPLFRQQLVALQQGLPNGFSISFVAGQCFIAIPFDVDLLQPPPNMDEIKEDIYYDYTMVQKIVNTVRCLEFKKLM
ncbi:MAG: DUF3137 domain-containing protein [Ginsengibacter sp.]